MHDVQQRADILEVVRMAGFETFAPSDVATVSVQLTVDAQAFDDLYAMYCASFDALKSRAALCHLLSRDKFQKVMQAPAIRKIIAWDHTGRAVGMMTLTTDLSTEDISEAYFAERFPEAYLRNELWYLGFVLVRPDAQRGNVFAELLRMGTAQFSPEGAVVAFDVCKFNDETFKFARLCAVLANRIRPSSIQAIDVQTYYAISYPAITGRSELWHAPALPIPAAREN